MGRRTFIGTAVASLVGLVWPYRVSGYTYDWNSNPQWSDDPRFPNGSLLRGGPEVHRVYLDGLDVTEWRITRLRTGADGYIVRLHRKADGSFEVERLNGDLRLKKTTHRGRVEYVSHAAI